VDNFENSSVTIYPNPTQDIFSISANSIINRSTVTIFNSIGQRLKTFSKDSSFFDISDLMSGIYYLKIETDQGTISEKIIKK
jgi:hypothetical protein